MIELPNEASMSPGRASSLPFSRTGRVAAAAVWILTVVLVELSSDGVSVVAAGQIDAVTNFRSATGIATPSNFKVAFIADTDDDSGQKEVLDLISERARIWSCTRGTFPMAAAPPQPGSTRSTIRLAVTSPTWAPTVTTTRGDGTSRSSVTVSARWVSTPTTCPGAAGVITPRSSQGLKLVFVRAGGDADFIEEQLADDNHIWKICSWHHNRRATNVGPYGNQVSASSYKACFAAGAIVAQGHSHTYSRSKTISDFDNLTVDGSCPQDPDTLETDACVAPGSSFFFDSSLGGKESRPLENTERDYWACYFTGEFGAVFIEFNVDGNAAKARGYFKSTAGAVHDSFIINAIAAGSVPVADL